jgi:hypothetical protein
VRELRSTKIEDLDLQALRQADGGTRGPPTSSLRVMLGLSLDPRTRAEACAI